MAGGELQPAERPALADGRAAPGTTAVRECGAWVDETRRASRLRDRARVHAPLRSLSVQSLALEARRGDRDAIGELYRRTAERARRTAAVWCDTSDVDDAVADGFARAISSFRQLRDPASVEAWIMRCVARAAIDLSRRSARVRPSGTAGDMSLHDGAGSPSAADSALAALDQVAVRQALDEMPARHRQLLLLRFHCGWSVREIAERLGAPEGTLRRRCMEASQLLEITLLRSLLQPASGTCAPITNLLCRSARGDLSGATTRRVAAHLHGCSGCRARNEELGELMASMSRSRASRRTVRTK